MSKEIRELGLMMLGQTSIFMPSMMQMTAQARSNEKIIASLQMVNDALLDIELNDRSKNDENKKVISKLISALYEDIIDDKTIERSNPDSFAYCYRLVGWLTYIASLTVGVVSATTVGMVIEKARSANTVLHEVDKKVDRHDKEIERLKTLYRHDINRTGNIPSQNRDVNDIIKNLRIEIKNTQDELTREKAKTDSLRDELAERDAAIEDLQSRLDNKDYNAGSMISRL